LPTERWFQGRRFLRLGSALPGPVGNRRWILSLVFALVTLAALALVSQRLTHTNWPLANATPWLVALAACCYFSSYVLRARGWHRLFPAEHRPDQARCLASVGAAAASGAVLPFRLDYVVKIGTLRKLGGRQISFDAIAMSIISLGIVDAVAMLPLSLWAIATSAHALRAPLLVVVVFGLGCAALLLASGKLMQLAVLRRSDRLGAMAARIAKHRTHEGRRSATIAGLYLLTCWTARAAGSVSLLSGLGFAFSPTTALCVLCLGAAAGVLPITAGGAVVNVGAATGILMLLGADKDLAINFSLASGLLLVATASVAALAGVACSPVAQAFARQPLASRRVRLGAS
jgi:uncharacterized membrane protein YbhN (UPF0104 family)